jgi:hypothetical protein
MNVMGTIASPSRYDGLRTITPAHMAPSYRSRNHYAI